MRLVNFNANAWAALAAVCHDPGAGVDLSAVAYVHPPGAVALVLAARARQAAGLPPLVVVPPVSGDVRTYLERVDVVAKLEALGTDVSGFADVRHHERHASASFTEVLDEEGGLEAATPVLWTFLVAQLGECGAPVAYSPLVALVSNVDRHADPTGGPTPPAAAHVQVYSNRIELAVGDLGSGFRASLAQNPLYGGLPTDKAALLAAIRDGATRHADPRHGGDVARVVRRVRVLEGAVRLQSRDGVAQATASRVDYRTAGVPFPGTLVSLRLPKSEVQ